MLRKRSRAVTSKQAIVGDQNNLPLQFCEKPASFLLNSPRILKGFFSIRSPSSSSSNANSESKMNPISILETQSFSSMANSLWAQTKNPIKKPPNTISGNQHSWEQSNNTKGIGVALVDETSETLNNKNNNNNNTCSSTKQQKRKLVVFGSQLKIQVPPLPSSSVFPCFSPESPREFGIKTPRSYFNSFGNKNSQVYPELLPNGDGEMMKETISMSDIEESEDYTCVISHGPNPKTTHIFGNCIVESCCGINRSSSLSSRRKPGFSSPSEGSSTPSQEESFLSFCYHCKKKLGHGNDIYMYRGEKAFCSQECRCQAILCEEGDS